MRLKAQLMEQAAFIALRALCALSRRHAERLPECGAWPGFVNQPESQCSLWQSNWDSQGAPCMYAGMMHCYNVIATSPYGDLLNCVHIHWAASVCVGMQCRGVFCLLGV